MDFELENDVNAYLSRGLLVSDYHMNQVFCWCTGNAARQGKSHTQHPQSPEVPVMDNYVVYMVTDGNRHYSLYFKLRTVVKLNSLKARSLNLLEIMDRYSKTSTSIPCDQGLYL